MEQTSLNQLTPSAGSSTSASASAVPLFLCVQARANFVGNYVTRVGNYGIAPNNVIPPHASPANARRTYSTRPISRRTFRLSDLGIGCEDKGITILADMRRRARTALLGGGLVAELAFNLAAGCNSQVAINHVAFDTRSGFDDEVIGFD